jgi:hypothetical protein
MLNSIKFRKRKTKRRLETMKGIIFLIGLIVLLTLPMASFAETAQECASNCVKQCQSLGSGKEYATCLENCLKGCYDKPSGIPDVPPPKPANPSREKSENNNIKIYAKTDTNKTCVQGEKSFSATCIDAQPKEIPEVLVSTPAVVQYGVPTPILLASGPDPDCIQVCGNDLDKCHKNCVRGLNVFLSDCMSKNKFVECPNNCRSEYNWGEEFCLQDNKSCIESCKKKGEPY